MSDEVKPSSEIQRGINVCRENIREYLVRGEQDNDHYSKSAIQGGPDGWKEFYRGRSIAFSDTIAVLDEAWEKD